MGLNYIRQVNAFYDRLELNPLNPSEIALWHGLMRVNNKTAWSKTFTVASSTLCKYSGIKDTSKSSTFYNARNGLQQKGLIRWRSRKGNQAAEYSIIDLSTLFVDNGVDKSVDSTVGSAVDNSVALTKQNETKQNNINLIKAQSETQIKIPIIKLTGTN
jgi:hypothetical protein